MFDGAFKCSDAVGSPLPDKTLEACKASDAVLLAAIGGYVTKPAKGSPRPHPHHDVHKAILERVINTGYSEPEGSCCQSLKEVSEGEADSLLNITLLHRKYYIE